MSIAQTPALERIAQIADQVAPVVSELCGKELDTSKIVFESYDKEQIRRPRERAHADKEGTLDKVSHYTPGRVIDRSMGAAGNAALASAIGMVYLGKDEDGKMHIAVSDHVTKMSDTELEFILAHELVHPIDDKHTQSHETYRTLIAEHHNLEEELLHTRHEQGAFFGYIWQDLDVRDKKAAIHDHDDKLRILREVTESHADYIQGLYMHEKGISFEDVDTARMRWQRMKGKVARFFDSPREKALRQAGIASALPLIEAAYATGVDIATLYEDLPQANDLWAPGHYIARHSHDQRV